ncbi:MAG TPA: hypothetical protein VJ397_05205 [Thermoplasmata archaeon]|nr:hypothetical protein [Thermoplasmata archaeon]
MAGSVCPVCASPLAWVAQYQRWFCHTCRQYRQPAAPPPPPPPAPVSPTGRPMGPAGGIWFANYYRIRKKVIALTNQYWIEDLHGAVLGYSKQKMFRLKEDIRIYTDESLTVELFRIKQQQILDVWATMAVIDSPTNTLLGFVRRKALMSGFVRDEWQVLDPWKRLVGEIAESTGRGLARKYLPGGTLIPEKVTLTLAGRPVAEIRQEFKIIGDIWQMNCVMVPPNFDRRVLLAGMLLMGMIERARK